MSAFNTVFASAECPKCCVHCDVSIQFKFADCWQHRYRLGDELAWGGNDRDCRKAKGKDVVVDGICESPCPHCGSDDEWNIYVFIEGNRLVRVETADGRYNFLEASELFIVLGDEASSTA